MPRKRAPAIDGVTTADKLPQPDPPLEPLNDRQKPEVSWRYATSRVTQLEVAVWWTPMTGANGETYHAYTITNHRSYQDTHGTWQNHSGHYRLADLPTLIFALNQAHAWIMAHRDLNVPLNDS